MPTDSSRIVIDTNLWISFLITRKFEKLDEIIFSGNAVLLFSEELLAEFLDVVKRPKFRRFFPQEDIEELLETIDEYSLFISVKSEITLCRDPKDNFILSLCFDGLANYLLTGDKDLLELKQFGDTKILTISDYLNFEAQNDQ